MGILGHLEHLLSQSQAGMLAQGPATCFQVQNRVVKRRHLLQDPGLHVGERVSFLLQTPPTTTGYPENGLKQVFKSGICCSKIQGFLPLFFLVSGNKERLVKIGVLNIMVFFFQSGKFPVAGFHPLPISRKCVFNI